MNSIDKYIENPCYISSIPYWKSITFEFPQFMEFVHHSKFNEALLEQYNDEIYFRISHNLNDIPKSNLETQYKIITVNTELQINEVVDFINRCYADIGVTKVQVDGWRKDNVFDGDLWIWIVDPNTNQPVALGIAELDREVKEGILEWIQVLPQYWRKGIGKLLVTQLLQRMKPKAQFATVSGKVYNTTNPQALYRSCGFTGEDLWHILTKK